MKSEDIYYKVGIKIKQMATSRNMTLKVFARRFLFCSSSYISQVIHGHRKPSLLFVNRLIDMGFDARLLQIYTNLDYDYNKLTINELVELLREQRRLLEDQKEKNRILSHALQEAYKKLKKLEKPRVKFTTCQVKSEFDEKMGKNGENGRKTNI